MLCWTLRPVQVERLMRRMRELMEECSDPLRLGDPREGVEE